jgi:hypothetical protein
VAVRPNELRVVLAALVAAGALVLAALHVVAARTDFLVLDLRAWQPVSSIPGLQGEALARFYESLQVVPPEQRPFRLTLQVPPTARPGDFVAAERSLPAAEGEHCLAVLTFVADPPAGTAATTAIAMPRIVAGDRHVTLPRMVPAVEGAAWELRDIHPRRGRIPIRFEVRAAALAAGSDHQRPAAIHFELVRLRACRR